MTCTDGSETSVSVSSCKRCPNLDGSEAVNEYSYERQLTVVQLLSSITPLALVGTGIICRGAENVRESSHEKARTCELEAQRSASGKQSAVDRPILLGSFIFHYFTLVCTFYKSGFYFTSQVFTLLMSNDSLLVPLCKRV